MFIKWTTAMMDGWMDGWMNEWINEYLLGYLKSGNVKLNLLIN